VNPSPPIELRVAFRGQGLRWPLREGDTLEVWRGEDYCGEIPGRLVLELVGHHIAAAELVAALVGALEAPTDRDSYYGRKPPARARARDATPQAADHEKSSPGGTAASKRAPAG